MTMTLDQWEDAVSELWERADSLDRDAGLTAMQNLSRSCPANDGPAALELAGLYDARHAQLAVQYGSTLRNLGRFDEAIAVLEGAPMHESTGSAPRVVLALALHSAGRVDEALRVALEAQIDALPRYQRSMRAYAAALTEGSRADPAA